MMVCGALSACATTAVVKKTAPTRVASPNPFAYMRKSAVCKVEPVKKDADGNCVGFEDPAIAEVYKRK